MLISQLTRPARDPSLDDGVQAAARNRRAVIFSEAHRLQDLQQPRVRSNPRTVRPQQFTALGLQDAQHAVANTQLATH